jgi:uncharacterized protein (DUF1810 family)
VANETENRGTEFSHFLRAQAPIYEQVLRELTGGCKITHWMWFIFPQLRGLGQSSLSERFAIESLAQACRYLQHDPLGPRLCECTELAIRSRSRAAEEVFGYPDWMKFHSSATLFSLCSPLQSIFTRALDRYFGGELDDRTLSLLGMQEKSAGRAADAR